MRNGIPRKENVCAIITTYHPDGDFPKRVECIAKQVGQVIIVDNNSDRDNVTMLRDTCRRLKIKLILNDDNLGVAAALNQGINLAHDMSFSWALLLDQDTESLDFMVQMLIKVYENFIKKDKLALIGSNYYEEVTRRVHYQPGSVVSHLWVEQKTVITSGSLLRISVFQEIGPFRNEFFIDQVDHEYCLRVRARGFKVVITRDPVMKHSLGAVTMHKLLWREIGTSNHSALRRYYMARNHIVLAREYILTEPIWVLSTLFCRVKSLVLMCIFENKKWVKLKFTILGFLDGLTSNFLRSFD